ncbi:MAG: hypothetical protein D6753_11740 [Planctomycetota bacterium]|nr:MAG: hypothetical protein D6753_11740 [Planctomycetota bacterium]
MKKLVTVGLLIALLAGCGRGWLPLYRGAPCRGCGLFRRPAMLQPAPCADCPTAAGYGNYDGSISGGEYLDGEVITEEYYPSTVPGGSSTTELAPLPAPSPGN